jgi:hypothetical protein
MSYLDPTREQFKATFGLPLERPVHMINLLRFREFAAYRFQSEMITAACR